MPQGSSDHPVCLQRVLLGLFDQNPFCPCSFLSNFPSTDPQVALVVKNPPTDMQETGVWSLGQGDPSPGGGNSNPLQYSCWENPWTEEPGSLHSKGSQKSWTRLSDWAHTHGDWWAQSSLSPAHPCTTVLSRFLSPRGCALAWEQPQSRSENQSLKQGVSGKEQTNESK